MDKFPAITAPHKSMFGNCSHSESTYGPQGSKMVLEIVHIEALITHELASGWFKFGKKVGRQKSGLPMGSRWGGAH